MYVWVYTCFFKCRKKYLLMNKLQRRKIIFEHWRHNVRVSNTACPAIIFNYFLFICIYFDLLNLLDLFFYFIHLFLFVFFIFYFSFYFFYLFYSFIFMYYFFLSFYLFLKNVIYLFLFIISLHLFVLFFHVFNFTKK